MNKLRTTRSVCPVCKKPISATLYEKDEKIFMHKACKEHGEFTDLYYGDAELYKRLMKSFYSGKGVSNPITKYHGNCAYDCGICEKHKSSPIIGIIDITNECNLTCPVCFAQCNSSRALYEPTIDELSEMMDNLRNMIPPCPVVLFSGGEPTIREDFPDICRMAHKKGFSHIIVATNGKRLAEEPDYHRKLDEAHVDIIYLQFDGVTPEPFIKLRGENLLPMKLKAIENIHKSSRFPTVVLVPTLAKGVNDHQVGDIVKFAADNIKSVRGVLFQPIALMGRVDSEELLKTRITSADGINELGRSFNGAIDKTDFLPTVIINNFLDHLRKSHDAENVVECSVHPLCFTLSYIIKSNNELIPLNRVIDLEKLAQMISEFDPRSKTKMFLKVLKTLPKLIKKSSLKFTPKIIVLLYNMLMRGSVEAALRFHEQSVLLVGFDHGSDLNNYDCEKVERCFINYSAPNGKIIPFCSYNMFHREDIEKSYSRSIE
ncbi:MAG: radical SAM protein [Ignavibacteriales bacterium]|nr:radical SAM protein [Ignavibacteriales bacterium]MCF8306491.1 radical SAM protein [Ignavibacteriales bacterium]MCF8316943.1 radical SAM protein [Ignavibacteriales bacterium]MCF8437752.1 radical SAM protein [Ignavibacteriales bacterium]